MRRCKVEITGIMPLLMHSDNVGWADEMKRWSEDPQSKKSGTRGDDRSPAWRWLGCLYHDGRVISMPTDNLARCLMDGGAQVPVPGGRGGKTFKAQTQSGLSFADAFWPLLVDGKELPWKTFADLNGQAGFDKHQTVAAEHGFMLFVKRAAVGTVKHIRVRPRFDNWSISGEITIIDEQITPEILQTILNFAGTYKGLGDWRPGPPSGKIPGPFGRFAAKVTAL